MNKERKYSSFFEEYVNEFDEYLDDVRTDLQYNNKEYKNLQKEMEKLIDTSENIQNIICNDKIVNSLSIGESIKLAKVISLYIDMQYIVSRAIYFKGGAETYEYFKKLGIL